MRYADAFGLRFFPQQGVGNQVAGKDEEKINVRFKQRLQFVYVLVEALLLNKNVLRVEAVGQKNRQKSQKSQPIQIGKPGIFFHKS